MASSRTVDPHEEQYGLCVEILKETKDCIAGMNNYLNNKTTFTPSDITQISKSAQELLAGVREQMSFFKDELKELDKSISTQKSKKAPDKDLQKLQEDLLKKLKTLKTERKKSYEALESILHKTEKEYQDTNKRLINKLTSSSSNMFAKTASSSKQEISPAKSHPSKGN